MYKVILLILFFGNTFSFYSQEKVTKRYCFGWNQDSLNIAEYSENNQLLNERKLLIKSGNVKYEDELFYSNLKKEAKYNSENKNKTISNIIMGKLNHLNIPKSNERVVMNIVFFVNSKGSVVNVFYSGVDSPKFQTKIEDEIYEVLLSFKNDNWIAGKYKMKRVASVKFVQLMW